ncbi:MAG: exopolyphosphatase [Oscillospiraceae bacterium]|jgi:nanoRNase/pAp phosphatase (c-di-AMP/oligoRNAs hydrolase)|nr:exopolyphosphatase [Oscillospiraceae bacterium]
MRLLTRSDFDGLACATLLKKVGVIDSWKFVHPTDIQDGIVEVTDNDVLANVPYVKGCKMWFDHHSSEGKRLGKGFEFEGESRIEDSTARIVYEYYGGKYMLPHFETMVNAVDKVDAAKLTRDEILNPEGWVLLGFVMDPRTGLGRFKNFRISNYELMETLIDACAAQDIKIILKNPDVIERVELYKEQDALFRVMLGLYTEIDANVIFTDLRGVEDVYTGNRFVIYSLYPDQNVSVWAVDGKGKQNCPIAVGHSIINRTCKTDVGALMLKYGGGGHFQVGTCQVPYDAADKSIEEIIGVLKTDEER